MKVFNAFFALYRTVLYVSVIVFLLVAVGPMAIGIRPYVVQSASMEPVIMTGSLVYIQQEESKSPLAGIMDYKTPVKGDIVAFTQGSGDNAITVVHRIYDKTAKGDFIMKGDNNVSTDIATINPDNIIGQYKFSIPKLGFFVSKLTSKRGIIVAVILMAIAFISSFISDGVDNSKEKEEAEKEVTDPQNVIEPPKNEQEVQPPDIVKEDDLNFASLEALQEKLKKMQKLAPSEDDIK